MPQRPKSKVILLLLTVASLGALFFLPRIPQPQSFHHFADTGLFQIRNFGNVFSNLPFLLIAVYGLVAVFQNAAAGFRLIFSILFLGVLLTGIGSAYYHWNPNNDTLVWDRLPMTIVFMSLTAAIVALFVSQRIGNGLLFPLVILGAASVFWWHYSESTGKGDLRLYYWVQFFPMIAIPLILCLFYSPLAKRMIKPLIWVVVWYVVAKILEQLDFQIAAAIGVSGHTLKHLAAALSTWYFVVLYRRVQISASQSS